MHEPVENVNTFPFIAIWRNLAKLSKRYTLQAVNVSSIAMCNGRTDKHGGIGQSLQSCAGAAQNSNRRKSGTNHVREALLRNLGVPSELSRVGLKLSSAHVSMSTHSGPKSSGPHGNPTCSVTNVL